MDVNGEWMEGGQMRLKNGSKFWGVGSKSVYRVNKVYTVLSCTVMESLLGLCSTDEMTKRKMWAMFGFWTCLVLAE